MPDNVPLQSKNDNPPKRHHFIPEFYQKQWAGSDGRVERYQRIRGVVVHRRVFPSASGFKTDLYRHPRAEMDEQNAQALEWAVFKIVDDVAAKSLEAMLSDQSALKDTNVRTGWTVFLRSMLLRTPFQMAGTLGTLERLWQEADVSEKYQKIWEPGMPETANEYLKELNPDVVKESAFQMYVDAIGIDRTTRYITNLPWRIFDCSDADYNLLLSDHPVVLVPLETKDGHIAMSLSPTKFLVAAKNVHTQAIANSLRLKQAVRIMNRLAVERAQHYVISRDLKQSSFINKHFGQKPVPPFLAPGWTEAS